MAAQPLLYDEVQELRRKLAQREAELEIISSVQVALAERLDVQAIYDLVGDKIRDIFQAQVVMISTYDPRGHTIEHRYAIENGERIFAPGHHPIRGFRIWVVEQRRPIVVGERVAELAAQLGQPTLPGTVTPKTWVGVPMIVGDQVTGILSLQDLFSENAFDEGTVRLLQTLAASMSVALENARLWEQEHLYRQSLEREFEIGRAIQAGFLPDALPQPEGWDIAARLQSAREVAGDFYDVFELPEGRIGLVIADVCDKGLGAALFMTLFRSLLRAAAQGDLYARSNGDTPAADLHAPTDHRSPADRLRRAISLTNNYIADTHAASAMFATVFFGIVDLSTGRLTYVNCGHVPPLIVDGCGVKRALGHTGTVLGALPDAVHRVADAHLAPGDLLFAYTDGLTDAEDEAGTMLGLEEVLPLLQEHAAPDDLLARVLARAEAHAGAAKQFDDITMLAVRRAGGV